MAPWQPKLVETPDGAMVHASCVAWHGKAVLICGASGTGKSELALQLMAFGADLVSDDQCQLRLGAAGKLVVSAPDTIKNMIEMRRVGLLHADAIEAATLALVVSMDHVETQRLPDPKEATLLGQRVRLLHNPGTASFPAAILQYLKAGEVKGR